MRSSISYAALAVALAAGMTAAKAQTFIPGEPLENVITQPAQSVTTETVQTIRPATRSHRQVVTTRRTVTTTPAPVAAIVPNPQPFYDQAPLYDTVAPYGQAPLYGTVAPYGQAPLYDTVASPPTLDETVLNAQPAATMMPAYHYIYEPNRILVIDPNTGITIQALPR